jgi:HYR domain
VEQTRSVRAGDGLDITPMGKATIKFTDTLTADIFHDSSMQVSGTIQPDDGGPLIHSLVLLVGTVLVGSTPSRVAQHRVMVSVGNPNGVKILMTGTLVLLHYDPDNDTTWIVVKQGRAHLSTAGGGEVDVDAGYQTWATADQATAPTIEALRPLVGMQFPVVDDLTDGDVADDFILGGVAGVLPAATPTPTLTPTPSSSPSPGATLTPTTSPTPTPGGATQASCASLDAGQLDLTRQGNRVDVNWNASGGCGPYTGAITANYASGGFTRDFAVSSLSGTWTDTPPPPRCDADNSIQYSLRIQDGTGQTATTSASTALQPSACGNSINIIANISPTPNAFGWTNKPTTVTWSVTDDRVGVASTSNCGSSIVSADTAGATFTCSAVNKDGNNRSQSVTVRVDTTGPTITAAASPAPNSAGWNNGSVRVMFTCSDSLSGVAICPDPVSLSSEGAGQQVSGTATDIAGNSVSTTLGGISIDKTAPGLKLPSGIVVPALVNGNLVNEVTVNYQASAADNLDPQPVVQCAPTSGASFSIGITQVSCTATDVAGNVAGGNFPVTVQPILTLDVGGGGTVVSNPPGINCTGPGIANPPATTCRAPFQPGQTVVLLETPATASRWIFSSWTDPAGACKNGATTCSITLNSNLGATAVFILR